MEHKIIADEPRRDDEDRSESGDEDPRMAAST
jgi:hypothetical protein